MSNARNLAKVAVDANGDIGTASLDNIDLTTRVAKAGDTMSGELTFTKDVGNHITFQNANQTKFYGRVMVSDNNDAYGSGERIFFGDGNNDVVVGTGNSSGTPVNSFIALRHSGEVSIGAGGSAKHLVIDTAGRVTLPYQPAFAYAGTSYSQSTGTWSTIIPATTKLNRGGHFNGSTGVFTAPIAGFYIFGFWGLSYPHNNGETNSIQYWLNGGGGSQNVQFNGASSNHALASGGYGVYLNANDTVELRYYRGSGSAVAYSSQWNMWGYLAN